MNAKQDYEGHEDKGSSLASRPAIKVNLFIIGCFLSRVPTYQVVAIYLWAEAGIDRLGSSFLSP